VKRYCVYVSGKLKGRMTASFIFCWETLTKSSHK
jgi:hypothetical protein